MASGDTKTQEYLNLAATGTRADLPAARGCCNTRTQDLIVDVADRIITEEETRAREDQVLQNEIDEIKNNPDVADIVPTYAALQDYDTSKLTDQAIIRVLADETHDGASTYYRWSTSSETFTYIGEAGDYYTKSQVNDLLDDKQDLLTAGDNVTIEDESGALVISATDTTYSDFTGTDGTAAGAAGLVPAPAATDAGKFLKADGTWDTAGGGSGPTVVQTTGTSTTDVMSQAATSQLIYPSGYETSKNRIALGYNANASSDGSIVIGVSARGGIRSPADIVIGRFAAADNGDYNVVVGASASTSSNASRSIAVGSSAQVPYGVKCAIALGANSQPSANGEMNIGLVTGNTTSGYNNSNYRLLTGLYDGQSAHDAATYGQVISYSAINGAGAPTTATEGKYVGQLYYDTTNEAMYFLKTIDTTTTPTTYTWEALGGGSGVNIVQTTGTSTTDVMSQNAVTSMMFVDPSTKRKVRLEGSVTPNTVGGTAIGYGSTVSGDEGIAIDGGNSPVSAVRQAIGIGSNINADARGAIAIGCNGGATGVTGQGAISIGFGTPDNSTVGKIEVGTAFTSFGYNGSNYRLLTGLYDPQSAHDAATKGYVDGLVGNIASALNVINNGGNS